MDRPEEVDQDFNFDAPAYYDLLNPSAENEYVNNADGYFNSKMDNTKVNAAETTTAMNCTNTNQTEALMMESSMTHLTILENKENKQAVVTSGPPNNQHEEENDGGFDMPQEDEEVHFTMPSVVRPQTTKSSQRPPPAATNRRMRMPKKSSASTRISSTNQRHEEPQVKKATSRTSLFQPTQSSMAKRDAILKQRQARRSSKPSSSMSSKKPSSVEVKKPLTKPLSPKMRVSSRSSDWTTQKSSTTLELQRIKDEMNQLKRIKEEHEHYYRMHEHSVPSNKTLYSKKPLTIPASPQFETDKRVHAPLDAVEDHNPQDQGFVKPEDLFSREYAATATTNVVSSSHRSGQLTISQSPNLATSLRAKLRQPAQVSENEEEEKVKRSTTASSSSGHSSSGLTIAKTPQLATSARAKVAQYKPVIRIDEDEIELSKPFRARPVNRSLFRSVTSTTTHMNKTKCATVPQSPQLSTASRIRRPSTHHHHSNSNPNSNPKHHGKTSKSKSKSTKPPRMVTHKSLTQPQSPVLRSTERHIRYREDLERKIAREAALEIERRQFKAKPMLVVTHPPVIQASTKPLTEVEPFAMPGHVFASRAEMKKSQARQEDLESTLKLARVKARACPDMSQDQVFVPQPCTKPLTEISTFQLASEVQAQKRQAFEHADALRRETEAKVEAERVAQLKILEQQELRLLRETELTFQSTPRQGLVAFQPQPSTQHLTVPESPLLQTKYRSVTEHLKKD